MKIDVDDANAWMVGNQNVNGGQSEREKRAWPGPSILSWYVTVGLLRQLAMTEVHRLLILILILARLQAIFTFVFEVMTGSPLRAVQPNGGRRGLNTSNLLSLVLSKESFDKSFRYIHYSLAHTIASLRLPSVEHLNWKTSSIVQYYFPLTVAMTGA
jgi:hypothetical protein